MQTTRQNKISRLIQQDLGEIFLREMKPVLGNSLITVTSVRITPDLSIARVHVSIMPIGTVPAYKGHPEEPATKQGIIDAILTHSGDIRRRLGLARGQAAAHHPPAGLFPRRFSRLC